MLGVWKNLLVQRDSGNLNDLSNALLVETVSIPKPRKCFFPRGLWFLPWILRTGRTSWAIRREGGTLRVFTGTGSDVAKVKMVIERGDNAVSAFPSPSSLRSSASQNFYVD